MELTNPMKSANTVFNLIRIGTSKKTTRVTYPLLGEKCSVSNK